MPELAEVERSRRLWEVGRGAKVLEVILRNRKSRLFRSINPEGLVRSLTGQRLSDSEALGKQMVFRFGNRGQFWLGLHLGMTGELRVEKPRYSFLKYDHLVLRSATARMVTISQAIEGSSQCHRNGSWFCIAHIRLSRPQFEFAEVARIFRIRSEV